MGKSRGISDPLLVSGYQLISELPQKAPMRNNRKPRRATSEAGFPHAMGLNHCSRAMLVPLL